MNAQIATARTNSGGTIAAGVYQAIASATGDRCTAMNAKCIAHAASRPTRAVVAT